MSPPWRGGQRLSPPVRQALRFGLREGSGEPPKRVGAGCSVRRNGQKRGASTFRRTALFLCLCYSMRLLFNMMKIQSFPQNFPLMGPHDWGIYLERFHVENGSVIVCGCFISTVRWKIQPFFQFSPCRDPLLSIFSVIYLDFQEKTSTIFYNTALEILFRLRETGGRCEGISIIYLCCSMPERVCLTL